MKLFTFSLVAFFMLSTNCLAYSIAQCQKQPPPGYVCCSMPSKGDRWVGNNTRRGPEPAWVCKDVSSTLSDKCKIDTNTALQERPLDIISKCTYQ